MLAFSLRQLEYNDVDLIFNYNFRKTESNDDDGGVVSVKVGKMEIPRALNQSPTAN